MSAAKKFIATNKAVYVSRIKGSQSAAFFIADHGSFTCLFTCLAAGLAAIH